MESLANQPEGQAGPTESPTVLLVQPNAVAWGKPIIPYETRGINTVDGVAGETALRHSGL